jgi:cytochrome P450
MPFGGGESLCPGRHFAKNEIAQFIAGAMLAFEMRLHPSCATSEAPKFDPTRVGLGIYPPEHDSVEMLLRRRTKV